MVLRWGAGQPVPRVPTEMDRIGTNLEASLEGCLDTPVIPLFKQFKESIEAASTVPTTKVPTPTAV